MVLVSAIAHVVIPGILNYLFLPLHILYFVISFASTKKKSAGFGSWSNRVTQTFIHEGFRALLFLTV